MKKITSFDVWVVAHGALAQSLGVAAVGIGVGDVFAFLVVLGTTRKANSQLALIYVL